MPKHTLKELQGVALAADMVIAQIEDGNIERLLPRMQKQMIDGDLDWFHVLAPMTAMLSTFLQVQMPDTYADYLAHVVRSISEEV